MNRIQTTDELPPAQAILASIVGNLGDAWLAAGLAVAEIGPQILQIHRRAAAHVADCKADLPGRAVETIDQLVACGFDAVPIRRALEDAFPFPKHRLALHGFLVAFGEVCEENGRQRNSAEAT